jgi:hypothetical protein
MTFGSTPNIFQQFLTEFWNDTKPPVPLNVFVNNIDPDSAKVNFTCSERSLSSVFVSRILENVQNATSETPDSGSYGSGQWIDDAGLTLNVEINVTSLSDETEYFFRIYTEDELGNGQLYEEIFSFSTSNDPPATISNVDIERHEESVVIRFDTDEGTKARVVWGDEQGEYTEETNYTAQGTTSHDRELTGLDHSTTYYYQIEAEDTGGNVATKKGNFTTKTNPDAEIRDIDHTDKTRRSIRITWNTNEDTTGRVRYGKDSGDYTDATDDTSLGQTHARTLDDLDTGTTYYYKIRVEDDAGQVSNSGEGSFTTLGDPLPIGYSSANNGGGSSFLNLDVPPGVQDEDILIAAVAAFDGETIDTPSGWHEARGRSFADTRLVVYWRKYDSGDGTYTFDLSGSSRANGGIAAYRNVDTEDPIFSSHEEADTNTQLSDTADGPGEMTVFFAACAVQADEGLAVISGGFNERFEPRSNRNILGADRLGDTVSRDVTFEIGTSIDRPMLLVMVSLRPI